jgi:hypothetical protein
MNLRKEIGLIALFCFGISSYAFAECHWETPVNPPGPAVWVCNNDPQGSCTPGWVTESDGTTIWVSC